VESGRLRGTHPTWTDHVLQNLDGHLQYAWDNGAITEEARRVIERLFVEHQCALLYERPGRLLHGDLGSHNVFIATRGELRRCQIIDWEDALLGDPIFDIASFASFYRMDEFVDAFLEGYCPVLPDVVSEETFAVRFWLYYLRIALAKSVLRFKLGYDQPGHSLSTPKIALALTKLRSL
jgi:Ser/Thr protein kinase RdoA (MazF antagonist)